MEKEIIPPIDKSLLKAELKQEKFLRKTNKANNEIYVITSQGSPNLMREIGRLRELCSVQTIVGMGSSGGRNFRRI